MVEIVVKYRWDDESEDEEKVGIILVTDGLSEEEALKKAHLKDENVLYYQHGNKFDPTDLPDGLILLE